MDSEPTMNAVGRLLQECCEDVDPDELVDADFGPCVDHIVELTSGIAFEGTALSMDTMAKARKLVGHFKESSQADAILLSKQGGDQSVAVTVIQDIITRWWSTWTMCNRLLRLKPYFAIMVIEGTLAAKFNLTESEWVIIQDISVLLEPFMIAQRLLEGEKYVTISLVLIIITTIRKNLSKAAAAEESSPHAKVIILTVSG